MEHTKIGFFAGSFDPFTIGHLHVVKEALKVYDKVIIGIAVNPKKVRRFPIEIMKNAITKTFENENLNTKIKIVSYCDLTHRIAKKENATHLIRGIRNGTDYEYEENLAKGNKALGGFETVYYRSDSDFGYLSSSIVMECFEYGEDISKFVPLPVYEAMKKYKESKK